jgi:hypothetical protein
MPHSYPDRATGQFPQASWFNGPQKDIKVLTAQVFNVREDTFAGGAKGDGTTDDTAAFQATIDAAIAAKGTLLIPPPETGQTYNIASTLTIQPASGSQAWMNIDARLPPASGLRYTGPSDSNVFTVRGWKYSRVKGLHIGLTTQDNVRFFDVVQDATYASSGDMTWENMLLSVGAGLANVGWRWGADTTGGDISFQHYNNCFVSGNTFSGTTDQIMQRGHVGWLNMNGNALVNKWSNCGWGFMSHGYRGSSILTHLSGAIDAVVTTLTLDTVIGLAPTGRVRIDTEQIDYTGISGNSLTGLTRAAGGTAAASHVLNSIVYQGVKNPLTNTWSFDRSGGGSQLFTGCGGSFNYLDFLIRGGPFEINGGRWEQGKRFLQAGYGGSSALEAALRGVNIGISTPSTLPADGIIIGLANPGVYTLDQIRMYGSDYGAAAITAGAFDGFGGPAGIGEVAIRNTSIRGTVRPFWTIPATWRHPTPTGYRTNTVNQPQESLSGDGLISADNGDAAKTLTAQIDESTQRWNTALTVARAVTLNTTGAFKGARFRIVREAGATGAFNLNIGTGPLKALTAAGQWAEVEYDGTAWRLTANGSL